MAERGKGAPHRKGGGMETTQPSRRLNPAPEGPSNSPWDRGSAVLGRLGVALVPAFPGATP